MGSVCKFFCLQLIALPGFHTMPARKAVLCAVGVLLALGIAVEASSHDVQVVGGYGTSFELFPRPPSNACFIPDLPQPRGYHSLSLLSGGRLVVCGGVGGSHNKFDSCISWVAGNTSWTPFYNMSVARMVQMAWTPSTLPDSIVLIPIGGNAEIVPGGAIIPLWSGTFACGIPEGDTIVLTGGTGYSDVTRYNINGFVKELPRLPENRWSHACSALPTGDFVVAGGYGDSNHRFSSVLTLLPGATAWTQLASLPQPLYSARASIVGGRMRVNGGWAGPGGTEVRSGQVLEYHPQPCNQWVHIGDLAQATSEHETISIGVEQLPCLLSGEEDSTTTPCATTTTSTTTSTSTSATTTTGLDPLLALLLFLVFSKRCNVININNIKATTSRM